MKHHKFTHTTITHHEDGSHTTKHHHEDGKSHKEYAKHDHDGMMDGMMEHTAPPNPGEAAANAGDHGIPAEHAAPAGIPMGAGAGAPPPAGA